MFSVRKIRHFQEKPEDPFVEREVSSQPICIAEACEATSAGMSLTSTTQVI